MRELQFNSVVRLRLVTTDKMTADILTKCLDRVPFERHRDKILNTNAADSAVGAYSVS